MPSLRKIVWVRVWTKTDLGLRHSMGTGKILSETPSLANPSLELWPCT